MPREVQSWGFKLLGSLSPPRVPKELNDFDSRGRPFPAFKGKFLLKDCVGWMQRVAYDVGQGM